MSRMGPHTTGSELEVKIETGPKRLYPTYQSILAEAAVAPYDYSDFFAKAPTSAT